MQAKHSQTSKIVGHDNSMRVLCMFGLAVVPAKLHQADLNPLWSRALRDTMFFHCKRLSVRQHFGSSQCAADGKCRFDKISTAFLLCSLLHTSRCQVPLAMKGLAEKETIWSPSVS